MFRGRAGSTFSLQIAACLHVANQSHDELIFMRAVRPTLANRHAVLQYGMHLSTRVSLVAGFKTAVVLSRIPICQSFHSRASVGGHERAEQP